MDVVRHEQNLSRAEKRFPRKDTCLAIYSHRVNTQRPLAETLALMFPWCAEWEGELNKLFGSYVERKIQNQALDYDDLLLYWHTMMQDEALAAEIGARFEHVLVDEYQDTNVLQAEILLSLKPSGAGLTVVGDEAQAIYSFRAATVENIREFSRKFGVRAPNLLTQAGPDSGSDPTVVTIELEENYRSTQQVLDAANVLIGKNLYSKTKIGEKPRYITVADDEGQAQYVVTRVLEARERGVLLRNQAVLFRASHHSDLLELELVRRNIPYVKYGGLKFLEAGHVKDLLAVLRWADNPKNRVAAFRALQLLPGVGPAGAARAFTRFEAEGHSFRTVKSGSAELDELMAYLGESPWEGQVQRVREWYLPHLERLYDAAQVRAEIYCSWRRSPDNFPSVPCS
jgi:DNA helicase-2/ATP-dependent DNA helicase PcrA